MELYAFRHGPSEERDPRRWPGDTARPLTREGVRATRRAARGLARFSGPIDRIATSPLERAKASAHLLADAFDRPPRIELWPELASGGLAGPIFDRLVRASEVRRLAIVGHEPTLGAFLGLAITGEPVALGRLSKAGAAAIRFPNAVAPGAAHLDWVATRKQLAALGSR